MNEKKDQEWHEITVTLPREGSDWIGHLLVELGSVGNLEEEYPDPALIAMKGFFPADYGPSNAIMQQICELLEEKGIKPISTYASTIKLQNWAENARQMFSPIRILDDTTIINPWSEYSPKENEDVIVINPGMAFGTGLHATTQLAARLIIDTIKGHEIRSMCDVGCGSAILSIVAAKKGVRNIEAVEIDHDAIISAKENVERNGFAREIKVLDSIKNVSKKFDLVVANILYSTILDLKSDLLKIISPKGFLILSGITKEEDEALRTAYKNTGLELITKKEQDGWMGYLYAAIHDQK